MAAETTELSTTGAWRRSINPGLIAITVMLATFMELLELSVG